ncbi:MAG TPA: hypothetical protein VJM32_05925 [Candidatus Saccharimonadales bacterium]|nr:hypothetical protein [Candidatus Saccharimonadales bacterium]
MRTYSTQPSGGYVALLAVLIVGAASVAAALALLTGGTDSQRSTLVTQQSAQARSLASACAEEALQQIHDSASFTGTNNISLGQGTCAYTVTNTGGANRTIDATGTVNSVVRKLKIYATINASSLSIISWQEVI